MATVKEFCAAVGSISMGAFPLRMFVHAYPHEGARRVVFLPHKEPDHVMVRIRFMAPDRDNLARTVPVVAERTFYPSEVARLSPAGIVASVRREILKAVAHEVDEFLTVNGELRFDPHGSEAKKWAPYPLP